VTTVRHLVALLTATIATILGAVITITAILWWQTADITRKRVK